MCVCVSAVTGTRAVTSFEDLCYCQCVPVFLHVTGTRAVRVTRTCVTDCVSLCFCSYRYPRGESFEDLCY